MQKTTRKIIAASFGSLAALAPLPIDTTAAPHSALILLTRRRIAEERESLFKRGQEIRLAAAHKSATEGLHHLLYQNPADVIDDSVTAYIPPVAFASAFTPARVTATLI